MQQFRNENQKANKQEFAQVINETTKLWRKHHFSYDQTKYIVKMVRKKLALETIITRQSSIVRLTFEEAKTLIESAYSGTGKYGVLIKTLFLTGARVEELASLKIEDVLFDENEIRIDGKGGKKRYVPILPSLSQEIKTYVYGRKQGYLFESNRNDRFTSRRIQQIVKICAKRAGITKRVHPHLLRHSIATILRQKGMSLDLVQKFLGHANIQTTLIYSEAPDDMMKDLYKKALNVQ